MKRKNPLPGLALFQGVKPDTLEWLFKEGRTEHFPRGSIMIRAKEPLKSVYIQVSGKSIVYNLTHLGKRKIIFIFGPGALLNEHVLNFHDSSLFCETIETSLVFILPAAKLLAAMERDFSLTKAILEAQERKLWRMGHQLKIPWAAFTWKGSWRQSCGSCRGILGRIRNTGWKLISI